jgi:hypothetical protein
VAKQYEVASVFNRWLAGRARELEAAGLVTIIPVKDFPKGAPIHEDGSTKYDPKKPLAFFAVECSGKRQCAAWAAVVGEWEAMRAEQVSA